MGRKRIGLQMSRLEFGYGVKVWQGAVECAESNDADLIVFPGRNLDAPHGFDYQYNQLFHLMSKENLDALILMTTLVANYIDEDALRNFCSRFEDLPIVSIGVKVPGVPSVVVDNRSGIREVVRHMALRHGARRIAFVRGPASNWEANERFLAYREGLEELGIPYDEALVGQGDFTPHSVRPALEAMLERVAAIPEAFVFANDEMAIKGMQILQERGCKIPASTKIAGFDDIAETATQSTPLTTVRQPLSEMGRKAFEMALGIAEGREAPELTVLSTELVTRSSCGCLAHCVDDLRELERLAREGGAGGAGRSSCLALAMASLRGVKLEYLRDVEAREASIAAVLDGFIGLCVTGAGRAAPEGSGDEDLFISGYGDVLKEEAQAGLRPGDWQYIVPVVADAIERAFGDEADARRLRLLARSCIVLSADMTLVAQNAANYESSRLNLVLHEVQYSLSSIMRIEDLVETMKGQLPRLGVPSFILSRFEREWFHGPRTPWVIPAATRLVAGFLDGSDLDLPKASRLEYPSALLYPQGFLPEAKRRTLVVYPLFFREMHYGTIVFEMTHQAGFVYESLTTQVSGILKAITLYNAKEKAEDNLRQAMMELETFNQQLSSLSLTDELTGLYNRRGFMKLASQQLSLTRQMGKNALLIYGDIDGLKEINDTYGHEEGDNAIKSAAEMFRKIFRTMDVIARLGGDEFTIFASNTNEKQITFFQARLSEMLDAYNSEAGKPYRLSLSLGCAECGPRGESTLGDYMREADSRLYARKAARKAARKKASGQA
jgi:diguanylate cyclase (GGDEF)-like protein